MAFVSAIRCGSPQIVVSFSNSFCGAGANLIRGKAPRLRNPGVRGELIPLTEQKAWELKMGASVPGDEFEKYAPKRFREQPRMPTAEPFPVTPAPMVPLSEHVHLERRMPIERDSRPERVPEPPPRSDDRSSSLFVRFSPFLCVSAAGLPARKSIRQRSVPCVEHVRLPPKADMCGATRNVR